MWHVAPKLDYVFFNEENIISDMEYEAPLGNSDHVVLCWRITVEHVQQPEYNDTQFNFWKIRLLMSLILPTGRLNSVVKVMRKCGYRLKKSCFH